ncbi:MULTISPECIES: restriction endonuclease subunit S [Alistipes]|uniref:restriction endonuclease subunit S n=1 Tax=Alistipes TaxID=239759 RepID=UPI001B35AE5E|nr:MULTISPECIES: restriction endonuclease subunit S [Alistipes]MBQ4903159.1 restriction endonuclease subunit S [Alistipes sp. Marseille-P2263]MCI2258913.1 restriction endonuclease subunit S [Alistipes dispar]
MSKAYPTYKDSGIEWLGQIPTHWDLLRNKIFITERDNVVGQDAYKYTLLSLTKQGVIQRDIESGKGKFPKEFDNYKIVESGNIIFCLFDVDETPRTVGLSSIDGMITGAYNVFSIKGINSQFYYYYFLAVDEAKALRPLYSGLRKVVKTERFAGLRIPVPPEEEQRQIVAYLDYKSNKINERICQRERELQTLSELKQAEIAAVVTRGLDPNVPMKESGIEWLGKIPAHWEVRKIKNCLQERSEKGYPNEPILCATQSRGVIPQDMYDNRVVVVNKDFDKLKLVKSGDFVISLRSFQGGIEYAYYQGIISAAYTILTPKDKRNSEYFKHLFKSHDFIQLLQTCVTGIREGQNINYAMLAKHFIPIPPIEEQQKIVLYIKNRLYVIDEYIAKLKAEINYLQEYKQRLISDVVTGKVDVRRVEIPSKE